MTMTILILQDEELPSDQLQSLWKPNLLEKTPTSHSN